MEPIEPLVYPCPTCEDKLQIKIDKNKKPYCICDICGVQLFIRKAFGILKLTERLEIELNDESPHLNKDKNIIANFAKLIILINRINHLNQKIEEIKRKEGFISTDEEMEKEKSAVQEELTIANEELDNLVKFTLI